MSKFMFIAVALLVIPAATIAATITLYPTDDSYISEVDPGDNYGSDDRAYTGKYAGGRLWGMLLFDLSPYSDVTVNDADIEVNIIYTFGTFPTPLTGICRYNGSWDETTITWNNRPGYDDYYYTDDPVVGWWSVDVTSWTQEWVDGSHANYGTFYYSNTADSAFFRYITKENSGTTLDPRLILDYDETSIESASLGEIKATFK